jgi:hypothetical protein
MLSRKLIKNQPGRRWLKYIAALGLLVATLVIAAVALAVQDLTFQLDGNAKASDCGTPSGTNLGGTVPDCSIQTDDWNTIFSADGSVKNPPVSDTNLTGYTNATFQRDFGVKVSATDKCSLTNTTSTTFCTADPTTYATGSKDIQPISGWQCNKDLNVNRKIHIMNAYAAAYTDPLSGDKILYFGLDKNKDNGDNNVGFWFLQADANCDATNGTATWTGAHSSGDILITSEFTKGGGVSGITIFRWAGGATGCIDSNNNPDPKTGGCNQQAVGGGGDCKGAPIPEPNLCATTNSGPLITNTNIQTPWLTADATIGVGHTVVPPDFFEGGIDLTKAFQGVAGGVPSCFNTFIADTRSSQQPTATLFDYARGALGECKTTLTTKAGDTANGGTASPTSIGTGVVSSGTDTATLTVTGTSTFSGTLTWYLCGPDAALTTCDKTKGVLVTTTTPVTTNGSYVSGTASLTQAGTYCWTAHFEPNQASKDAGVKVGDDNGTNECFTVAKVTPALTTCSGTFDASFVCTPSATVDFGSAVTDRARLTGLATEPGSGGPSTTYPTINPASAGAYAGTITFTLKGPAASGCGVTATGGTGTNPQDVPVDTLVGNKVYGPVSYTPGTPGKYHWQATIANTSSLNNILPVTDNANCDQAREDVTVQQIPTQISTTQKVTPQDSATITSSVATDTIPAGGTVTFYLYAGDTAANNLANCQAHGTTVGSGGLVYKEGFGTLAVPALSETFNSNNTIAVTTDTTVYWRVTYATGDSAHLGIQSDCAESTSTSFHNDSGPGTTFP